MQNKDKRSLLFSFLLGDGCLSYQYYKGKPRYGYFKVNHSLEQADYLRWKADLINKIFDKHNNVSEVENSTRSLGPSKQLQYHVSVKRFRVWKKHIYPNNKKDIARILKYIIHPEFAMAILLMDDGSVQSSNQTKQGRGIHFTRLRIHLSDQSQESLEYFKKWCKDNFDIEVNITTERHRDKVYPLITINVFNSLKLWSKVRDFILQFESMKNKFKWLEIRYAKSLTALGS